MASLDISVGDVITIPGSLSVVRVMLQGPRPIEAQGPGVHAFLTKEAIRNAGPESYVRPARPEALVETPSRIHDYCVQGYYPAGDRNEHFSCVMQAYTAEDALTQTRVQFGSDASVYWLVPSKVGS